MSMMMQIAQQSERSTGHRVVIVEDDPAIAELLQIRMELAGHRTRLAKNAAQALDEVFSFKPHCVMLDIGLPGRDGLNLLKQLRSEPTTRHIPVMMLTARTAVQDVKTAIALGAEDYMAKPFDDKTLLRRVARLLDPAMRLPQTSSSRVSW